MCACNVDLNDGREEGCAVTHLPSTTADIAHHSGVGRQASRRIEEQGAGSDGGSGGGDSGGEGGRVGAARTPRRPAGDMEDDLQEDDTAEREGDVVDSFWAIG